MKKISVIIPCYNIARWIDRCIASVAVQTIGLDSMEVICVDDASTDGTWERLQKWEQKFPEHMLLIRQDVNRRQGATRNLGLRHASAPYIAFVDGDDWLEPDYFEQLYAPIAHQSYDVVACGAATDPSASLVYFDEKSRGEGEGQALCSDTVERKKEMLIQKPLNIFAWAKIIRKELLLDHQIYFPEGLLYEDNYWYPLLHIYADTIYIVQKRLYHYFMRDSSTVHAMNDPHHLDRVTIQLIKWEDYEKRGLLQSYRAELEYDGLYCAMHFMRCLVFRYDRPSFSYYQLQREVLRQRIPDDIMALYADTFSGLDRILFNALYQALDAESFQKFIEQARCYIYNKG